MTSMSAFFSESLCLPEWASPLLWWYLVWNPCELTARLLGSMHPRTCITIKGSKACKPVQARGWNTQPNCSAVKAASNTPSLLRVSGTASNEDWSVLQLSPYSLSGVNGCQYCSMQTSSEQGGIFAALSNMRKRMEDWAFRNQKSI